MASMSPAQQRVWDGLLAVDQRRPPVDQAVAPRWRAYLEDGLLEAAALIPAGQDLFVNKTALSALDCDGRYLDHVESEFSWPSAAVLGQLAHAGIEIDTAGGRRQPVEELVAYAWGQFATSGSSASEFVEALGVVEADALRAKAAATIVEFRECFPALPPDWLRAEVNLKVRLYAGRVLIAGRPDFVIGRTDRMPDRRLILIDLKSANRHSRDRHDMRLYALLATLKYGVAPFRVATYYLDEAAWDHEDVDDDVLEAAARTVVDKVTRAARLRYDRPPDHELRLVPGYACRWCGRGHDCPAKALADADAALAAPG